MILGERERNSDVLLACMTYDCYLRYACSFIDGRSAFGWFNYWCLLDGSGITE